MTLITKGMGVIMKKGGGDLLKKSKKFPGPKADMLLNRKVKTRVRPKGFPKTIVKQPGEFAKGVKVTGAPVTYKVRTNKKVRGIKGKIGGDDIDVHARIGRTQRYRNLAASSLKQFRNPEKYKSKVMKSGPAPHSGGTFSNIDRKKASQRRKLRTKGSPFKIGTFNKKEIPQKYRKDIK